MSIFVVVVIQSLSHVPTLWDPMNSSTPAFPVLHHLPELAQMHVHWVSDPSNHLIFCYPLLLLSSIFPSIKIFPKESALHIRWPKYWSFSFSISPSNKYSGLISFQIDCVFSPCCPRDPQGSFWAQEFKCISSSVLSLLYGPVLTSISIFSSVQSLSHVRLFATPRTAARQASLSITNSWSLLKLMSIELVMPSYHLILCHPLLLLPSSFPSIRVFSNESVLHIRWPKYWNFSFSPSNKYSGLISFRIDWLWFLVVQGTLKSLLQHHSSKASILWHSAFFIVQLSHPYMTTGKIIALTRWTFVGKVMFLLFNMLFRFVIAFLPRSKCLLISWLQSPSTMIWSPKI